MMNARGQAFTAMKLVQGAIIALVLLGIVYGALNLVKQYEPGSDVLTISADLLSSAYEAAGTGQSFTRDAKLRAQFLTGKAIKEKAGIDDPSLVIVFQCALPVGTYGGKDCTDECKYGGSEGCDSLMLKSGSTIPVCVYCSSQSPKCFVVLGARSC